MIMKENKLVELCVKGKTDIVDGPFGSDLKSEHFIAEGIPTLKIQNIKEFNVLKKNLSYVSKNKFEELSRHSFRCGDIVLTKLGAPLGAAAIVEDIEEGLIVADLVRIRINQEIIDKKYLCYLLNSPNIKLQINSQSRGATRPRIKLSVIRDLKIFYPSLSHQKLIVSKLDTAFSKINSAVCFNQKNLNNAKRVYSNGIDEIFGNLSSNNHKLGENSEINYGFTTKASFEKGNYKILRITDIQKNSVNWETVPYCEIEKDKLDKMLLRDGDIVFARTGATTGKSFLVKNPSNAVFASYLIRVSVNRKVFDPDYVMHFFQSAKYWQQINAGISGSTQGGFNASKLSLLEIPIINKNEQRKVVHKLNALRDQALILEKIYERKLEQYSALKTSFLSKLLINLA